MSHTDLASLESYKAATSKLWVVKPKTDKKRVAFEEQKDSTPIVQCSCKYKEDDYNFFEMRIEDLQSMVEQGTTKISELKHTLDSERSLRMEELYKREFQKRETDKSIEEIKDLKSSLRKQSDELRLLIHENKLLKERERVNNTQQEAVNNDREGAYNQLQSYENQIARLEELNDLLRMRLAEANSVQSSKPNKPKSYPLLNKAKDGHSGSASLASGKKSILSQKYGLGQRPGKLEPLSIRDEYL